MDKVAVVTGSTKGIGQTITDRLLRDGWQVCGVARSEPKGLAKLHGYRHFKFDLSQPVNLPDLVEMLPPKIDLLVNNAGTWEVKAVEEINLPHLEDTFNLNLFSPALLTKLFLPRFSETAMIINISSIMSMLVDKGYSVYSASKAALDHFFTTLAKEKHLNIVTIGPSSVDTPSGREKDVSGDDPATWLTAEEVAAVVMRAVAGNFSSGSLIVVVNNEMKSWWKGRDKYQVVNVDKENK